VLASRALQSRLSAGALATMRERFSIRRNVAELAERFATSANAVVAA
jgi:hypothetical protein